MAGAVLAGPLPDHRDLAAPRLQADAEGLLDGAEIFVGDSEECGQPGFGQGYGVMVVGNRLSSSRP